MKKTVKQQAKAAVRITLLVLLALLLGLGVYQMNATRLTGDAVPMPLGFGCAVVLSGSMEPELSVGDLLVIVPAETYGLDDVVVYQDGRTPVVHRIVQVDAENQTVTTKGDANNTEDLPIAVSLIKGRVVCAIPLVGHVVNVIKTPIGILLILGLAIFLMERSFRRDKQAEKEQLQQIRQEIEKLKQEQKGQRK